MFHDFHGDGAPISLAGQSQLLELPPCTRRQSLPSRLDSWMSRTEAYGELCDLEQALTMLMMVIPDDLRHDELRRNELQAMPLPEHRAQQTTGRLDELRASCAHDA